VQVEFVIRRDRIHMCATSISDVSINAFESLGLKVITVVVTNVAIFWDIMPCSSYVK
jgi:hypothetical protein